MRTATLLLVGPNKLSRAGLKSLFKDSSFTVVGEVSGVDAIADTIAAVREGAAAMPDPDVALVECPGAPSAVLELLECLQGLYPDMPAVVLSDKVCMETLAACLAAGAGGLLTKDISRAALLSSLQLVVLGETVFPTCLAGLLAGGVQGPRPPRIVRGDDACGLSDREIETVQCLLRGESNKLIAKRLSITEATIKVHIKSVLRKIKASNRTQAAIWAYSHGYLPVLDVVTGSENEGHFGLD